MTPAACSSHSQCDEVIISWRKDRACSHPHNHTGRPTFHPVIHSLVVAAPYAGGLAHLCDVLGVRGVEQLGAREQVPLQHEVTELPK